MNNMCLVIIFGFQAYFPFCKIMALRKVPLCLKVRDFTDMPFQNSTDDILTFQSDLRMKSVQKTRFLMEVFMGPEYISV